jgi:hypothetical protein
MSDPLRTGLATLHHRTVWAVKAAQRLIFRWTRRHWEPPFERCQASAYRTFSSTRRWLTPELRDCLTAARVPPDGIPGVPPAVTTHDAALAVVQDVQLTFDLACGGPHVDPLSASSWQELDCRLNREYALAVVALPVTPPTVRPSPPEPPVEVACGGVKCPVWDATTRTLTFGEWSHTYRRQAPSQERVLAAFQATDWPERVMTGLPDHLSETVRNIKNSLSRVTPCPIRFERDGTGKGVRWRPHTSGTEVS